MQSATQASVLAHWRSLTDRLRRAIEQRDQCRSVLGPLLANPFLVGDDGHCLWCASGWGGAHDDGCPASPARRAELLGEEPPRRVGPAVLDALEGMD